MFRLATTTALLLPGVAAASFVAPAAAQQLPADVVPRAPEIVASDGPGPLFIHSRHVRARRGVAKVIVECPPAAGPCRGTLLLRSLLPEGALASRAIAVAPGERRTVRLRVRSRNRVVPGRVAFRTTETLTERLVVVHGA